MKRLLALALVWLMGLNMALAASPTESPAPSPSPEPPPVVKPRNTVNITLFNQDDYGGEAYQLAGYAGRTLETSGCFLFAYAHARQFLTGERAEEAILMDLLSVCRDPNGYYGHRQCAHTEKGEPAFHPFNRAQGGPLANDELPARTREGLVAVQGLREFFARGKRVLCLHGGGHHVLGVEMRRVDGENYVHIIDSHWGSIQDKVHKPYYYLENGEMVSVTVDPDTYGFASDYWMHETDAADFFKVIFAWKLNPQYTFALE